MSSSYSSRVRRSGGTPRARIASLTTPVPGPISSTGPANGSTCRAMASASAGLDGISAPIFLGRAIRARRKRRLSARVVKRNPCLGSWVPRGRLSQKHNWAKRLLLASLPEFFHTGKEALGLGLGAGLALGFELAQQFLLPPGQPDRGFHRQLDIKIAPLRTAQHRHPLTPEAELPSRLGAFGNGDLGAAAIQGRHVDTAAHCGHHE